MRLAPAPRRSLCVAVLGSVALHAVLLGIAWTRPPVASQSKVQVIEARLLVAPAAPVALVASTPPPPPSLPVPDVNAPAPEQHREPVAQVPAPLPAREMPALSVPVASPVPPPETRPPVKSAASPLASNPVSPSVPATPPTSPVPAPVPVQPEAVAAAAATSAAAYLPVSELDPPPRPLTDITLVYPPGAGLRAGEVVLDLLIGTSGVVEDVKVIEATPPGLFEASAISAFVSTRFSPGMRAGVPTAARMRVAVQYSATGMSVSGTDALLQRAAPR